MIKKITFFTSLIASGLFGIFFTTSKGTTITNPVDSVLDTPIFSIERAEADAGGGDCSSSNCDVIIYPDPTSSGVGINIY